MQYKFLFTENDGLAESEFSILKDDLIYTCKEPFKISLDVARELTDEDSVADIDRVYEWQITMDVSSKDVKAIEMLDEMQGEDWGGYGIEDFKEPEAWQNWIVYQSESLIN